MSTPQACRWGRPGATTGIVVARPRARAGGCRGICAVVQCPLDPENAHERHVGLESALSFHGVDGDLLYGFWFAAERSRYYWELTSFAGTRFPNSITGGALLGLTFTNALLVMFMFVLGFPWTQVRHQSYVSENLTLAGPLDPAAVQQQARSGGAAGEGLAGALDMDLGF